MHRERQTLAHTKTGESQKKEYVRGSGGGAGRGRGVSEFSGVPPPPPLTASEGVLPAVIQKIYIQNTADVPHSRRGPPHPRPKLSPSLSRVPPPRLPPAKPQTTVQGSAHVSPPPFPPAPAPATTPGDCVPFANRPASGLELISAPTLIVLFRSCVRGAGANAVRCSSARDLEHRTD